MLGAMAVDGLAPLYYSDVTQESYLFIPQNAEVSLSLCKVLWQLMAWRHYITVTSHVSPICSYQRMLK